VLRELFRIPTPFGDFPVFGYGAMVLLGVLFGVLLLKLGARRRGLDEERVTDLPVSLVLFGLLGGRAWYCIQFRHEVFADGDWTAVFRLWEGGLVLYGAIAGGLLGFVWLQRREQYGNTRDLLDLIAPALAIGIAFGRLGCFLNGCCWGEVCPPTYPFAVSFPPGSPPALAFGDGMSASPPLHPTQIYSTIQGVLLCGLLWWVGGRWGHRPGRTFALFLGLYSIGRSVIESIRADHGVLAGELTVSQQASLVAAAVGIWLWMGAPEREMGTPAGSEKV